MTTATTVQSSTRRFTIVAVTAGIVAVVLALPLAYYVAYSAGMLGMVIAVLEPVSPLRRGLLAKAGAALAVIALALSITANAAWALVYFGN
ncbi:hypothetical protein BH09ACT1_BH09ACT1_23520 [soil metagenome]